MQTCTLGDPAIRLARLARIQETHIAPLTAFVDGIRRSSDPRAPYWAPYFDPASGGTAAEVLFLLESPGPKVSQTGFVSADNPDRTAENMSCLLKLAGLSRSRVLLWNSFPWQLSAERVMAPTEAHLVEAAAATLALLPLLPRLRVIVLVGSRAARGWTHVAPHHGRSLTVLNCPHPSPVNFMPKPEAAALALSVLGRARQLCS